MGSQEQLSALQGRLHRLPSLSLPPGWADHTTEAAVGDIFYVPKSGKSPHPHLSTPSLPLHAQWHIPSHSLLHCPLLLLSLTDPEVLGGPELHLP